MQIFPNQNQWLPFGSRTDIIAQSLQHARSKCFAGQELYLLFGRRLNRQLQQPSQEWVKIRLLVQAISQCRRDLSFRFGTEQA